MAAAPAENTPLQTLMMGQAPLPFPLPAVTDPTPAQQWERSREQTAERAVSHSRSAQESTQEASKQDTGFFGKIGSLAKAAGSQIQEVAAKTHASAEAGLRKKIEDMNQSAFCEKFPDVLVSTTPPQQCIANFSCSALSKGEVISGDVFLCATHVCFAAKGIRDAIPLARIGSIQPSVVLPTSASGAGYQGGCLEDGPPFIIPTPAPQVVPTCVQIFTMDGRIVQLLKFDNKSTAAAGTFTDSVSGNAFGRFYNDLDHAWRAATEVPVPGVQYAPGGWQQQCPP